MCWAALGTGLIVEVRGDSRIAAVGLYFKNNGFDVIYFLHLERPSGLVLAGTRE